MVFTSLFSLEEMANGIVEPARGKATGKVELDPNRVDLLKSCEYWGFFQCTLELFWCCGLFLWVCSAMVSMGVLEFTNTAGGIREIFQRRNVSAPPQLHGRTNWQPVARGRGRQCCNSGGKRSQSTQGGKGKHPKACTFSREVVLLKTPGDTIARGVAKAELQWRGHVISNFEFDKTLPANLVVENLLSAFETSVPSLAEITCEPKVTIMMGMGPALVEPRLTTDQELNGEMISKIFSQRTVWLLPCQDLCRRTPDIMDAFDKEENVDKMVTMILE